MITKEGAHYKGSEKNGQTRKMRSSKAFHLRWAGKTDTCISIIEILILRRNCRDRKGNEDREKRIHGEEVQEIVPNCDFLVASVGDL